MSILGVSSDGWGIWVPFKVVLRWVGVVVFVILLEKCRYALDF